jgi:hypothetical protein
MAVKSGFNAKILLPLLLISYICLALLFTLFPRPILLSTDPAEIELFFQTHTGLFYQLLYADSEKVAIGNYPEESEAFYPEYFRDWLRIGVGLRKRSLGQRPMGRKTSQIRTIVNVEGGQANGLAMLLRASEGIAHAKWDSGTKGFKKQS